MIQVLWWPMYFSLTYYILVSIVWPLPWLELRPGGVIWFENDQSESRKQPTRRPRGWKDRVRYVQMTTLKEIGDLPLHHTSLIILPNINCVVQSQMTITTHTTATQHHWSPQAHPINMKYTLSLSTSKYYNMKYTLSLSTSKYYNMKYILSLSTSTYYNMKYTLSLSTSTYYNMKYT